MGFLAIAGCLPLSLLSSQAVAVRGGQQTDSVRKPLTLAGRVAIRSLHGLGGIAFGGVAGGAAGYYLLPRGDCGDDPGLCEMVAGAMLGSFVGLTMSAAGSRLGSTCSYGRRVLWSAGGSLLFGSIGYAIGGHRRDWLAAATPVGALVGGAFGADMCAIERKGG